MSLGHGANNQVKGAPNLKTRQALRTIPQTAGEGLSSDGSIITLDPIDDGQVLANTSGSSDIPIGTSLSALLDHDLTNVQGSVIFRNATQWTFLGPSTSGFFLETRGAGLDPQWAAAGTSTGANPTATASDTAVNGVAVTFMRSDAAPAVQKCSASQFGLVKVDGTSITASGGVISATTLASANPTATASDVAVNGVATTYMRSDAAPAVQLGSAAQKGLVQVDNTTITASSGVISASASGLGVPVGANPTATASDVAVNGVATTYLRSDGAPAVQKGSSSQFGLLKVDGTTIVASSGIISTTSLPASAQVHPGYVSGRYYGMEGFTNPGTFSSSANTLYATPFYCALTTTFTKAAFRCSSGGAGNYEFGIYNNSSGQPGTLKQDLGSTAVTNNALNVLSGLTITLSPGWYWLAIAFSSASVVVNSQNIANTPMTYLYGTTDANTVSSGITGSWTYSAGNIANPFPTISYSGGSLPILLLGL